MKRAGSLPATALARRRGGKTLAGWVTEDGSVQAVMLENSSGMLTVMTMREKY